MEINEGIILNGKRNNAKWIDFVEIKTNCFSRKRNLNCPSSMLPNNKNYITINMEWLFFLAEKKNFSYFGVLGSLVLNLIIITGLFHFN